KRPTPPPADPTCVSRSMPVMVAPRPPSKERDYRLDSRLRRVTAPRSDRRAAAGPGGGAFQLGGETEADGVLRLPADDLHADRQPRAAHRQWHAGRRLAADVEGLGVGHEGEQPPRVAL